MCCADSILLIVRCHWKHSAKAFSGWKDEPEVEILVFANILVLRLRCHCYIRQTARVSVVESSCKRKLKLAVTIADGKPCIAEYDVLVIVC